MAIDNDSKLICKQDMLKIKNLYLGKAAIKINRIGIYLPTYHIKDEERSPQAWG